MKREWLYRSSTRRRLRTVLFVFACVLAVIVGFFAARPILMLFGLVG